MIAAMKRYLPLACLVALIALAFAMGWHRMLTLDALRERRAMLVDFVAGRFMLAVLLYAGLYVAVVALSLPGGAIMTVAGGFLFGKWLGTPIVIVAATIGATVLFLVARSAFGDVLRARAGPFLRKMEDGFRANAFWYLLSLRLIPLFPFFAVNLVPALLGVPLATYVLATAIGIMPASFVFASFGAGLGEIFDRGEMVSLTSVLTPGIMIALVGFAVLALIPVALKHWRRPG
jgi:uncharacterized membrane protein YdjX (TVP38/TMEM64 family)